MAPTLAHGVGRIYESPLPVWLYLFGAPARLLSLPLVTES